MTPAATARRFYEAFAHHDAATMASCYAPDATFADPAFGTLTGPEVPAMWAMLLARSQGKLTVTYVIESADERSAHVRWHATYPFSRTGRTVHNIVRSHLQCTAEGLIATQTDRFDLWRWARQALGLPGWLVGWTGAFRAKLQAQARAGLAAYRAQHPH